MKTPPRLQALRDEGLIDDVLLMERVTDAEGAAAPRLNDVDFTPEEARAHHATLLREVVRMLLAGAVHGDLSEFSILLGTHDGRPGPVIIDLPQAVDAAGNHHARRMLLRDVGNLRDFFGRFAPALRATQHGEEIWALHAGGLLREIDDARAEEAARRLRLAGG